MNGTSASLVNLFREQLNVDVEGLDTDLIGEGLMDSLMLVELLTHLEETYQITIDLANLDIEHFRSISSITRFVDASSNESLNSGAEAARKRA